STARSSGRLMAPDVHPPATAPDIAAVTAPSPADGRGTYRPVNTNPAAPRSPHPPSAERQPAAPATPGSTSPARKAPIWTPDCFTPVTIPCRPACTTLAASWLVAGFPKATETPNTAAPATNPA